MTISGRRRCALMRGLFKKETIIESIGIVTVFTALERVIQVGRGIVFARLLGPTQYGVYTLAFFFIPLVATFAKLGIPSCFTRYVPQYEKKGNLKDFFKKTYLFVMSAGAFIGSICFLNAHKLSGFIYGSPLYYRIVIMISLVVLPYAIFDALAASFAGLRLFKSASLLSFSQFFIFTLLGIILVIFYPRAESAILASLLSFVAATCVFSFIFHKHISGLASQALRIRENDFYRKIFRFSIWFVITPLVYTLFIYTDRWMIARFLNLSSTGVYSVASNVSGLIFTFGMIVGNVLMPNLSKSWEQGNKKKAVQTLGFATKANTLILLTGAVVLFLFKSQIVSLLYGEKYAGAVPVVGALLIFWLFNSIPWTMGNYAQLIEKTYIRFSCSFIGLASNVLLNYILIPRYGLMGAAFATVASSAIIVITMFLWFWREGLRLRPATMLVCILPFMLLCNRSLIIFLFLVLAGLVLKTDLIITRDEKDTLRDRIKSLILKRRVMGT